MLLRHAAQLLFAAAVFVQLPAAEEVLVIEQNYNIVESGKDGPSAKDVKQVLYIHKDMICIDEMGGRDGRVTESIVLDLKNRKIVNLNHVDRKKVTEDFDARRNKIKNKRRTAEEDIAAQPAGPQRDRVVKLWKALLDDDRKFVLNKNAQPEKEIAGVSSRHVRIVDAADPNYTALEAYLHPEIEMPFDNADTLYLLFLVGEKMSEFLKRNRDSLRKVPMELHLDIAAGGHLDTLVTRLRRIAPGEVEGLANELRPKLGDPFAIPEYEERALKIRPQAPGTNDRPD